MEQQHRLAGTFENSSGWFANPLTCRSAFNEFPEAQAEVSMPIPGTFRHLRVRCTVAPGAGTSRTVTFRTGAAGVGAMSNTTLTVTVADAATENTDSTNSFHVNVGDRVSLGLNRSGAALASDGIIAYVFEPDDPDVAIHGFGGQNTQTAALRYTGLLYAPNFGSIGWPATVPDTVVASLVAIGGTVTGYTVRASTTPGVGNDWTFAVYKNGIKQDGTGGTVDTTATLNDANFPVVTASFSLLAVAGDLLAVAASPTSVPTASRLNGVCVYAASQANLGCSHSGLPAASATRYFWPVGGWSIVGAVAEADREQISTPTTLVLDGMRVRVVDAGGLDSALTLTLRKSQAATVLTATVSGSSPATATAAGTVSIPDGDEFSLEVTAAGAVGANTAIQVAFGQGEAPVVVVPPLTWLPGGQTVRGDGRGGGVASGMTPGESA